jgi:hypothetical protein
MYTQPALRPRIPGTSVQEPGVPQYFSVGTLAWGAPYGNKGVLTPPVDPTAKPSTFKAFKSVFAGLFGTGDPSKDITRDQIAASQGQATKKAQPFYQYHIGDLFTPGTQNFVFEPTTELTPLKTIWGNAFLSKPNAWPVLQPPQVWSDYRKYINGIGGLIAGQYALQPLESIQNG